MKLVRCPVCHTHIDLLSLVEDQAGRELLIEVAKLEGWFAPSLLTYIALFKPAKSDLNNARALKLIKEVLSFHSNKKLLAKACDITVQQIRAKRVESKAQPLKDHKYIKSVIDSNKHEYSATNHSISTVPVQPPTQLSAEELARQQREHFERLKG